MANKWCVVVQVKYKFKVRGKSIIGQENYVHALVRSQCTLQQLPWPVTWTPRWCTMGYYQRVRGHYLPVRVHWELPSCNVGAGSLQNILHSDLSQLCCAELFSFFSPPSNMTHFPHHKMSAVSQEEEKRKEAFVSPLLLKISLVKFGLSQRLPPQTQGIYRD